MDGPNGLAGLDGLHGLDGWILLDDLDGLSGLDGFDGLGWLHCIDGWMEPSQSSEPSRIPLTPAFASGFSWSLEIGL